MNPGELFTQGTALALLAGLAAGAGLTLIAAGLLKVERKVGDESGRRRVAAARKQYRLLVIALAVGLLVGLATQWPVLGVGAAVLVFCWDKLFGGYGHERLAMRRVEALAMWTESLRDTIAGAVGLEQAIPASARAADPVLRVHLESMLDRLRGRTPMAEALQLFADDLDDASADVIIAALILNAKLRGPGLRDVLSALARSAREEVDVRQRVIAQRAGTRRSVQIIMVVVIVFVLGMALFNRQFVKPYGTLLGEMVLLVVLALFGLGFFWLRRLSNVETPGRLLIRAPQQPEAAGRVPVPAAGVAATTTPAAGGRIGPPGRTEGVF